MNLTPEMKAQLAEQKKQCIFCKLIAGEMPAKTVFEDGRTIGMLDIYPALKGHTLFMPKEHYPIMPYLPGDEFSHFFGILPRLSASIMKAMISTGVNVFIANGGVAGQQASHFLVHVLPREAGDGFFNFFFDQRKAKISEEKKNILQHNFPTMMANHFSRNPAAWHQGAGERPAFLKPSTVLYEDEKVLVSLPEKGVAEGHIEIYSKEEKDFQKLSPESASHLFFVASFAATAVFEGLGAHGTNIIVKSGVSDDNPSGRLSMHIIPRKQDDGLKLQWEPKQPKYNLDEVVSMIKDKTWEINVVKKKVLVEEPQKVEKKKIAPHDEIRKAIERLH
ncbi:hypothetical protein COV20_02210 [Candidatus Woesearchaeota archaeon CG10_big_fil_rev_8_21_14_0_10_45_16]|nr:MAG: hypothetical protein COV20_02210 [Candidatus Woesearchaeota archaeon CG10_big_fil_rev_8_21_14_0_10_45_16]